MTTADAPFGVWETAIYAFLNSFPYMALVLFSFRKNRRWSKPVTYSLLAAATVLIASGTVYRLFSDITENPLFDVAFLLIYVVFIFLAIRQPVGKLVFTVLVLMNLGNLVIMTAKCLEGLIFGDLALLRYHWTYSLMMFAVLCAALPALYLLIFRDVSPQTADDEPEEELKASRYMWRYLWLIPAVFYLIWSNHFYASGQSALETALDPLSTGYLLLIDLGSILIYRVIIQLTALHERNSRLQMENHILSVRNMQYEHLNARVEEVRRDRHDLRHHLLLLKSIRDNRDWDSLDQLLAGYPDLDSPDRPLKYCENEAVNAILSYFGEKAAQQGVGYSVRMELPENTFVSKPNLTVLFGNLLENALEACAKAENAAFIRVSGGVKTTPAGAKTIALIVENSYSEEPHVSENGVFRSTKHKGDGVGIVSVRNIAERYNGACSFLFKDGVFTASILLNGNDN